MGNISIHIVDTHCGRLLLEHQVTNDIPITSIDSSGTGNLPFLYRPTSEEMYCINDVTLPLYIQFDLLFVRKLQGIQIVTYKHSASVIGNVIKFTISYGQTESELFPYMEFGSQIKVIIIYF